MARRGRPLSARAASARVVQIKLRLYPSEDDDLIAFFAGVSARLRAAMVKRALRSGLQGQEGEDELETDDLFDALDELVL